ncbi:unnamed protein product [Closterium sp. Naga37s-1]|nr:unnamed protein product [Closterium sp. Naga37s-1]
MIQAPGQETYGDGLEASKKEELADSAGLHLRGPKRNIRFIKADRIEEFSVLGRTEEIASLRLPYVDLAVLHAKEDAAVRKAEGEAERIGVGVTAEAQDIFFALCKT